MPHNYRATAKEPPPPPTTLAPHQVCSSVSHHYEQWFRGPDAQDKNLDLTIIFSRLSFSYTLPLICQQILSAPPSYASRTSLLLTVSVTCTLPQPDGHKDPATCLAAVAYFPSHSRSSRKAGSDQEAAPRLPTPLCSYPWAPPHSYHQLKPPAALHTDPLQLP